MKAHKTEGPLVLGASGRVGRLLMRLWADGHWQPAGPPVWQVRPGRDVAVPVAADILTWDILHDPAPDVAVGGVLALAGVTAGDAAALSANTALALAACDLGCALGGVPVLIASTQAVYGPLPGLLTEAADCAPVSTYGQAKLAMERAVAGRPGVTCLRIGNLIGADQLLVAMAKGPVSLDRFADGRGPRRSMIGPLTLARVCDRLLAQDAPLPGVLNIANPGLVAMEDILSAAAANWSWQPAPDSALPELALDVTAMMQLCPLPDGRADDLLAEVLLAGWRMTDDPRQAPA